MVGGLLNVEVNKGGCRQLIWGGLTLPRRNISLRSGVRWTQRKRWGDNATFLLFWPLKVQMTLGGSVKCLKLITKSVLRSLLFIGAIGLRHPVAVLDHFLHPSSLLWDENACVSHLPRVDGVESSTQQIWPWPCDLDPRNLWSWPTTFALDPDTCTLWPWPLINDNGPCNLWPWPLWPWPWPSWPWPRTTFSDTRLKTRIFKFFTLVTLTFDLWPWPSTLFEIW